MCRDTAVANHSGDARNSKASGFIGACPSKGTFKGSTGMGVGEGTMLGAVVELDEAVGTLGGSGIVWTTTESRVATGVNSSVPKRLNKEKKRDKNELSY